MIRACPGIRADFGTMGERERGGSDWVSCQAMGKMKGSSVRWWDGGTGQGHVSAAWTMRIVLTVNEEECRELRARVQTSWDTKGEWGERCQHVMAMERKIVLCIVKYAACSMTGLCFVNVIVSVLQIRLDISSKNHGCHLTFG